MTRLVCAALLALWWSAGARAETACRLALALGLDISGSVDAREYRLQLDGLAGALLSPEVQRAALAIPHAPVSLAVFEWGGPDQQRLLLDWTELADAADLARIAAGLRATSGAYSDPSTAIGSAILYGVGLLRARPGCWQHTLDISGDGPANTGRDPGLIPDAALEGITVNGLVVVPSARANTTKNLSNVKTLLEYYRADVIRGPNAFVESAADFADFERAMIRKLTREMQELTLSRAGQQRGAHPLSLDTPLP